MSFGTITFQSGYIRAGASGGALFDENWHLVGMIIKDNGLNAQAIPIDLIIRQLQDWNIPVNLLPAQ
ncbi:MAG: hypothetical protein R2880_15505 [Deinococcales bacterium]